ncbi:MAG: hypothetical protein NC412_09865 [Roseburia sp.]|nr:hypothetical protein [Roseburia sp.]
MKIREFECDICHKRIGRAFCFVGVTFDATKSCEVLESDNVFAENTHFCEDCAKRVMEEKLTPLEDKSLKATKKEGKRPKKGERLDAGKVMALHRAGWNNEEIADEMGVTER